MDDMADSKIQCEIGLRESIACNDPYHKATFQQLLGIHSLLEGAGCIIFCAPDYRVIDHVLVY